jgi:hypothetical protein
MESPMMDYNFDRLKGLGWSDDFIEKMKDDPCWKGYTAVGMKTKNGRKVPNCVKVKPDADHKESFDIDEKQPMDAMAIGNVLPKEPGTGPAKNPQMKEAGIRMPRMEEIVKSSNRNGHLAMAAAPNYAETEDYSDRFYSDEPNGNMLITQLRVAREKIDIMLGMLYPDDNLEPWAATKIANAGVALASVADYLRFGGET